MIVVGVDGSGFSLYAVEWATEEAARRGRPLRLVHAVVPWLYDTPVDPRVRTIREWMLKQGHEVIDEAVAAARERDPDVPVEGRVVPGPPAWALQEESRDADLLVVARHGAGGAAGLLIGSVALQVVSHARVPVVAVRRPEPAVHREVVLGIDGPGPGDRAIGFAFQAAALRRARLRAVHAWTHPESPAPGDRRPLMYDLEPVMEEERRFVAEAIAGRRDEYPDVDVTEDVVYGRAVRVLSGASARADLLVVGSRGRGGFEGLLLGSVSHALLHQAHCPLAVVP